MAKEPPAGSTIEVSETDGKTEIKIPADLSKVSAAKAKELLDHGLIEERELPGKWYKRKVDGFQTKISDYTFHAYTGEQRDQWDEIKLVSEPDPT